MISGRARRAMDTLTFAAGTKASAPGARPDAAARSVRRISSSSSAICASVISPPYGAAGAEDDAFAVDRKSLAVADRRCTGMPSVLRSKRSARICSCLARSAFSSSSSLTRALARSAAFSMFRSKNGRTRLNISAMIASRSVGSMSFCRNPFNGRPSTIGSSTHSSPSSAPSRGPFAMPAFCAACAAASSSSSRRFRSASGSTSCSVAFETAFETAVETGADAGSGVGGLGPSHTRVRSRRYALAWSPGRSGLFHDNNSPTSSPSFSATSSSFMLPFV
mmetsp:Transcript_8120/g.29664  ORF Transcript_8120/g.29664 Transcript_8120/m.29664 type:complete len:278 (+) Transcript_8120:756-1589(+)